MAMPERPDPIGRESADELLHGAEPLTASLLRTARRHLRLIGALSLLLALSAAGVFLAARGPAEPQSRFSVAVTAAAYDLPHSGGIDSTLTLANHTAEPLILTAVTLGRAGGQDVGLGSAVLDLGLAPGEQQTVVIHGDFDCRPDRPALPASALFTGADRTGRVRTMEAALPGSPAFSAGHAAYRDQVCKLPYPLALADITYLGTATPGPGADFATTATVTLAATPDAVPVSLTAIGTTTPGVRLHTIPDVPITVTPGGTTHVTLAWTADCAAIPPYYGIPTITATAVDARATETRHYALGQRFDDDLAAALARACPGRRH